MRSPDQILFNIAERLPQVVDPALRMRLSTDYLTLLQQWHKFPRVRGGVDVPSDFPRQVEELLLRVNGGQVAYKFTPALGTINGRFYKVYSNAMDALARLSELLELQRDIGLRARWEGEITDLETRIQQCRRDVESSSANANLSKIDAAASQVSQYLAARILPMELEWRKELNVSAPQYASKGESGVVSRFARPDLWYIGRNRYPSLTDMGYGRKRLKGSHNYVQGLGENFFDQVADFATSVWSGVKEGAEAQADAVYALFTTSLSRAKAIRERHNAHSAFIVNLRESDPERASELQKNLDERRMLLVNAETRLKDVAASLNRTSFYSWDEPTQLATQFLGALDTSKRAVVMLYADDINAASAALDDLEAKDIAFEREADSYLPTAAKVAIGAGGGLALAALGVGAFLLMKRK